MRLSSPAKINLFLTINGRRPDGFHDLETLMCPIDLLDTVELTPLEDQIEVEVVGMDLPTGPDNLAYRAADAVRREAGLSSGVRIRLEKHIPAGGGLAGGSSNAATVLRGCNALWNAGLDNAALHRLAAALGSDVNLFLEDGPCLCRGRGEIVEPVQWNDPVDIVLLNPGFGVPTPWAFKTFASMPADERRGVAGFWHTSYTTSDGRRVAFQPRNDLEPAVFSKYLWLPSAKEWLRRRPGVHDALMSGSGATLFALTSSAAAAKQLVVDIREQFGSEVLVHHARPYCHA